MTASVVAAYGEHPPAGAIELAVKALSGGDIIGLPTDTVYGLAADPFHTGACDRLFRLKGRPRSVELPVLVGSEAQALALCTAVPASARRLMRRFWPGPLTLVLPRRPIVPDIVTAGLPTVAVRMSAHPLFRAVLNHFGSPVAAPSANRFGRISPTAAAHVLDELEGRIPLILDGGPCALGVESTVVAPGDGALRLLRSGPVTAEELALHAPVLAAGPAIQAPGQLESHYAPRTPLCLLARLDESDTWQGPGRAGLLAWSRASRPVQFAAMEVLTPRNDPREAATRLFAAMRRLDSLRLDLIVAEPPPPSGLGAAILDRLRKAAAPR